MSGYAAIQDSQAWGVSDLTVRISREAPPAEAAPGSEAHAEWERQRAANPRLYNAPILSVVSFDAEAGEMLARRETYQRLVIQPRVMTGVRLLGVTGILVARGEGGEEHVLLGRRAPDVRIYGGMWELGPSGGVGVPPRSVETLTAEHLTSFLSDEAEEEVGLEVGSARPVAVVRDLIARSDDVALRVEVGELGAVAARPVSWEYTQTAWVAVRELAAFEAKFAGEVIGPTRALMRLMGWA